jgi:tetratricopeptide (TPR) repeat protein
MSRRAWWTLLLILVALTAAGYVPVLSHGLIWDDWPNIGRNPHFRGLGSEQLGWAFTSFRQGHYQPLTWISFGLDYVLWGTNFAGYHLTNVLIHLVNVVLFGLLAECVLRAASGRDPTARTRLGSLVAAAIFALHPMRVESVAWLTERRHLLAAGFFLASILVYLAAVRRGTGARPSLPGLACVTSLFGLSLLATPLGIALPVVLLVLDFYPLRRPAASSGAPRRLLTLAIEKWPLWFLSALFAISALAAQRDVGALLETGRYDLSQRCAQAAYAVLYYPRALFSTAWYPLHERPYLLNPLEARFLVSALVFVFVTTLLFRLRVRFPALLAVWSAYLALLAPVSGLAQSGMQLVADRYSYLACLGFALLLGALAARWWAICRGSGERALWVVAVFVVLAFWGSATRSYVGVWGGEGSFWRHVAAGGGSSLASSNLAEEALRSGATATALRHSRRAIEIAPTYGRAWMSMRAVLESEAFAWDRAELIRTSEVLESGLAYQTAAAARYIAGLARLRLGDYDSAADHLARATRIKPDMPEAWLRWAQALSSAGRRDEAIEVIRRGAELNPDDPRLKRLLERSGL